MTAPLILIAGASDLGTACALRLFRAGAKIVLLEKNNPIDLYHSRCFSSAVFSGKRTIEQVTASTFSYFLTEVAENTQMPIEKYISFQLENRQIPLILESEIEIIANDPFDFSVITSDALYRQNYDLLRSTGKVIGFAGEMNQKDFDYTICKSGVNASRVLYPFLQDEYNPEDADPAPVKKLEVINAPLEGVFEAMRQVNELVHKKDVLGTIAGIPILSPVWGRITGMLNSGLIVPAHQPFIEINVSGFSGDGQVIPPENFNLAGGALETIFYDIKIAKTS